MKSIDAGEFVQIGGRPTKARLVDRGTHYALAFANESAESLDAKVQRELAKVQRELGFGLGRNPTEIPVEMIVVAASDDWKDHNLRIASIKRSIVDAYRYPVVGEPVRIADIILLVQASRVEVRPSEIASDEIVSVKAETIYVHVLR